MPVDNAFRRDLHAHPEQRPSASSRSGRARESLYDETPDDLEADYEVGVDGGVDDVQSRPTRPRRPRPAWRSPLTGRILLLNLAVLAVPVLGLLHLDQYRDSLIQSELEALKGQAVTMAQALGSTAVQDVDEGHQNLNEETMRNLFRVLPTTSDLRARLFDTQGSLIGDSFVLGGPAGQVQVEVLLPPNDDDEVLDLIGRFYDRITAVLPGSEDLPVYVESDPQQAADYSEVESALQGESAVQLRQGFRRTLVLSVAVPVQRYRQVLAALMVTKDGRAINQAVLARREDVLLMFGIAFAVTVLLSLYLSHTIARPIRSLALAADRVRGGVGRSGSKLGSFSASDERASIPNLTRRQDEIGDLSEALIEMTEALHNRMVAIEGFAADVSHEIKNPLTSLRSAVETATIVKDPAQQKKLMAIIMDDVGRLDRLISDISDASRLDAELARSQAEEVEVAQLLETLVEVMRTTGKADGPSFEVSVSEPEKLKVLGLEGRLGQVFRNLLTNAVSFAPANSKISLAAWREDGGGSHPDWIFITVSDQGPGIPKGKEDAVFSRFYTERPEGEKFGTHSGLGLSISRQIVEALRGEISAENRPEGGACFTVKLPAL
ncbi:stimulus-sensing domain-containing protein [Rhodovibrionaceae bacterium A322]